MQCTNSPMSRKDIEYEKIGKSCSGTAQSNISYFLLTICYQYSRFSGARYFGKGWSWPPSQGGTNKKIKFNKLQFDN